MAKGLFGGVLRHLRRAALLRDGADLTDGELLECYLARRDEAAFESLLLRHGPMVLGVCRRVLRNEADAHDAFQATFLVFVRKAGSIVPRARVGNWLYGVAHKTALKAQAMNRQRRAREQQAAPPARPPGDAMQELLDLLDEALSRLPHKYRTVIVLCDLEERPLKEAAAHLGCPQGTVASRLARAREMLATRLARRGLVVGCGVLGVGLAQAVPTALAASTVRAASLAVAGRAAAAGAVSAHVAALADAVAKSVGVTAGKALTATLLAAALLGGVALLSYPALKDRQTKTGWHGPPRTAASPDRPRSDRDALQGTWVPVSAESNGERKSEDELRRWGQLTFAGDKVARQGTEPREGTYAIDPDSRPRAITLFTEFNPWRGIYELKGSTLKLALKFGGDRPTEFGSRDALLVVFEKQK
jgi:RNA polymerase sigma-70 factor (ECF subfamily)